MSSLLFGKAEFDSAQNIRETENEIIVPGDFGARKHSTVWKYSKLQVCC